MKTTRGFTLAELLACVALVAVVLALAVPGLAAVLASARIANGLHGLTASLAAARLSAIVQGQPVSVCPSADGLRCRRDLVWDEGWIVFRDPAGLGQPADATAVVQHADRPLAGVEVRSTPGRHLVRFQATGMAGGGNVSLRLCAGQPARLRGAVIVSLSGRARVERHAPPGSACPWH